MNLTYFISPKMTKKGDNRKEYQKAYWAKYKGSKRRSQHQGVYPTIQTYCGK